MRRDIACSNKKTILPEETTMQPSTEWKEQIAPDEAERFERYARDFASMQERKSQKYGKGRALHRKQLQALKASFEVLPGLPEPARHGLFASPGRHEAWIRLSNGGFDRASNAKPDIRGFAIKVFGVAGPSALGSGEATEQNFLLINHSAFAFPKSDEFVELTMAASKGGGALLFHLFRRYGLAGGFRMIGLFAGMMGKQFKGFAGDTFYSATPMACGPYAMRVRIVPVGNPAPLAQGKDSAEDMGERLSKSDLAFDFQVQFFVNETSTPIENASVDWEESVAPYVTVACLHIPQQNLADAAAGKFAEQVEAAAFDPWGALMDHRPLGDVMRARKAVYYASEKTRGAL
jgi:hypothetical protein